ncbi:MAG: Nif3-like dinuclear metal center hexameric protein [Oscillospiraceae bacterium]|nr:Nif3-like dinuclear metal center hexameric protein [Oscillospiraceae bacterium]
MTTASDILKFIESVAPPALKLEGDNVGMLCGRAGKEVKTVLVALDPFVSVCKEAQEVGADLLVTHHPLIHGAISAVTDGSPVGRAIFTLIANDITAINAHTNLDCADGGVNDTLAKRVGLNNIEKISADPHGLLRQGQVTQQSLEDFLPKVKQALGCAGLRYVDGGKPVQRVAVGGGSCGSELATVAKAGCDTFVTADIKYNQFWDAKMLGINLIDAGHFYTENPVVAVLAGKIQAAFPNIQVKISKKHADCMKFY